MRTHLGHDVASIAASLGNQDIHLWLLDYRRESRRAPLIALLGVYLGLPLESIVLRDDEHGRPELQAPWNSVLAFNWSHSAGKALIAIARDIQPGVDIERVFARERALDIAERFFHVDETRALRQLHPEQRDVAFLQLWTSKEAIVKALGRGIAFGLQRFSVTVPPATPKVLWLDSDDAEAWQLHTVETDDNHVASVAWRGAARTVSLWTLADPN